VAAEGTGPLAYRWSYAGAVLAGETNASLTLANVAPAQAGEYVVAVTNAGGSATSRATLTVLAPPVNAPNIVQQPISQIVCPKSTAALSVKVSGEEPFTYQWMLEGRDLPGATSALLVITNFDAAVAGSYAVTVRNAGGMAVSAPAILTVSRPIRILQHPATQAVPVGGTARFSVVAEGPGALEYQWYYGSKMLLGATKPTYELSGVHAHEAGRYSVRVLDACGSVRSQAADLCVLNSETDVHILSATLLTNSTVCRVLICGPAGTNAFLQASPDFKVWTALTNFTFRADNLYEYFDTDAGQYARRFFKVAPLERLRIAEQPQDQAAQAGAVASLSVRVEGTAPWTYQWRFNGRELPGATNALLQLTNVQHAQSGSYQVRVNNPIGGLFSAAAQLCVVADHAARIVSAALLGDRSTARLLICGPAGNTYQLQASENLVSWTLLSHLTLTNYLHEFFDTEAGQHAWRFYKLDLPPLRLGRVTRLGDGTLEAVIEGPPSVGRSYEGLSGTVHASTDLKTWTSLGAGQMAQGKIRFVDPQATASSQRFYQVIPNP
jgi:hypothetical protein